MPAPFFPNESCFTRATAEQTVLALSEIHLFKSGYVPTVDTTIADLEAQEADYTTYAAAVITAWLAPIKSSAGGAQITAATNQFSLAATPAAGNTIGGYWIQLAGGDLYLVRQFDDPQAMLAAGDGFDVTPTVIFPNGQP